MNKTTPTQEEMQNCRVNIIQDIGTIARSMYETMVHEAQECLNRLTDSEINELTNPYELAQFRLAKAILLDQVYANKVLDREYSADCIKPMLKRIKRATKNR